MSKRLDSFYAAIPKEGYGKFINLINKAKDDTLEIFKGHFYVMPLKESVQFVKSLKEKKSYVVWDKEAEAYLKQKNVPVNPEKVDFLDEYIISIPKSCAMTDIFLREEGVEQKTNGYSYELTPRDAIVLIKDIPSERGFVGLNESNENERKMAQFLIENKMVIVAPQYENELGEPNYPTYMDERK